MTQLEVKKAIAKKIVQGIEDKGINRKEFASLMKISQSTVSQLTKGYANPTLRTIFKIEEILGITIIKL